MYSKKANLRNNCLAKKYECLSFLFFYVRIFKMNASYLLLDSYIFYNISKLVDRCWSRWLIRNLYCMKFNAFSLKQLDQNF